MKDSPIRGLATGHSKNEGGMKVRMTVMKEVAQHGSGYSFGELALINNKPRAATVYVRSNKCIMAVLNKRDYLKVLGDSFKQMVDQKINKIR